MDQNTANKLNWRKIEDEQPEEGQEVLTKMKHGVISGYYCVEDQTCSKYYWRELEWYVYEWVPIEEVL